MSRAVLQLWLCTLLAVNALSRPAEGEDEAERAAAKIEPSVVEWHDDYGEAMRIAKAQQKMMFVWFHGAPSGQFGDRFEASTFRNEKVLSLLERYVSVKLPTYATITVDGQRIRLLDHAAFQEMNHSPGIAIIDLKHRDTEHYGYVVTALPFTVGKYYRFKPEHLNVALNLPTGTLTQRTLVFAVRIHPEKPASTRGQIDPNLVTEAKSHSTYQAQIRVQGHHRWGERFPRLSRLLFGLRPQEIVAESWPHEGLVDAAVDVVDSWHHSSGHWNAVYSNQNRFGYDMKKGSNGIWYATGLFGNNR